MATELERLIVRIEGDTRQLRSALRGAEQTADRSTGRIRRSFQGLTRSLGNISRAVFSLRGALVGLGAGLGLARGIRTTIQNTIVQQRALTAVEAAIRATGGAAGLTTKELADMASEFQKVTAFGDEFVLEISSQLLAFRNITRETFQDSIAAILDFSTQTGRSATRAVRLFGAALNDPTKALTQLETIGISFTEVQKDLIKGWVDSGDLLRAQRFLIDQLNQSYGGAAVAARGDLGPAVQALNNAFGDLFENVDNADQLTEAVNDLTDSISDPTFQRGVTEITTNILALASGFVAAITAVSNFKQEIRDLFEIPTGGGEQRILDQFQSLRPPPIPVTVSPGGINAPAGVERPAAFPGLLTGLRAENAELQLQLDLFGESTAEIEKQLALLRIRNEFGEGAAEIAEDAVSKNAQLTEQLKIQTDLEIAAQKELISETEALNDVFGQFSFTATSALEEVIVAGGTLSDVLTGLEQDVLRLITRFLILEPLQAGLQGAFSAFGVTAGGGTGGGGIAGAITEAGISLAGLFGGGPGPGIPGAASRQGGGRFRAGQPIVVGEKRPELLIPDMPGTVLPRVPTGGSSGQTIEMTVVMQGVRDADTLRQNMPQFRGQMAEMLERMAARDA